jgi:sec-independent protein translocase protein TatA
MHFGVLELLIIAAIILLIFGPKQIPKLASTLRDSIKSFKEGTQDKPEAAEQVETTKEV